MEKSSNIALLFDQDLWGFGLNRRDVGDDFWVKLLNVLHAISIIIVENAFGPELKEKYLI